jgi:hypothetical protein
MILKTFYITELAQKIINISYRHSGGRGGSAMVMVAAEVAAAIV